LKARGFLAVYVKSCPVTMLFICAIFAGLAAGSVRGHADAPRLPILAEGGDWTSEWKLSREVVLPTPGVWYLWLKVTNDDWKPATMTWTLDGRQPLHSSRSRLLVPSFTKSQWVSHTAYARGSGFRMQVHVEQPGKHTLTVALTTGDARMEAIALTLYFSARPDGDTLDHSKDPGGGLAEIPFAAGQTDGFRTDWPSPPVEATGAVYYVDAQAGDEANDGRSPERPWRSFAPVNTRRFQPGDGILLKRAGRWEEGLAPQGDGTAERWITVGAYGEGARPYINGLNRPGVSLRGQSYWRIQDLEVTNEADITTADAISVVALEGKPQPKGISIANCIAFDSGGYGIHVGSKWGADSNGYDGVVIENCLVFANADSGIQVNGNDQNGCRNTVIRNCTAYSNPGMAGIWIHSGQNGLIEHCVAYNNNCINIWTWNAINITIRYCEAFRGLPPSSDKGGFDIDWGSEACTLEYCYSHHNEGVGILLMGNSNDLYRGFPKQSRYNVCRYSVSENFMSVTATFEHGLVYNNIIVSNTETPPLDISGWPIGTSWDGTSGGWPSNTEFLNNIAVSHGPTPPLSVSEDATKQGNVLDHNLYWRVGSDGPFALWGGHTEPAKFWEGKGAEGRVPPQEFATLEEFQRATGQELHGIYADPRLRSPGDGGIGRLPLEAYRLLEGSPAFGAGRRVELSEEWLAERRKHLTDTGAEAYGIPMEPQPPVHDYWGNKLGSAAKITIGAQGE
jgi:hypothetical protein